MNINYAKFGPSRDEVRKRDKCKQCQVVKFRKGKFNFPCDNTVTDYELDIIPLSNRVKI